MSETYKCDYFFQMETDNSKDEKFQSSKLTEAIFKSQ